jgi:hypothetical protein
MNGIFVMVHTGRITTRKNVVNHKVIDDFFEAVSFEDDMVMIARFQ